MLNTQIALALGFAVFGMSSSASPEIVPGRYSIEVSVKDRGTVIAEPRLITAAGETARVQIGGKDGSRFEMTLSASQGADAKIVVRSNIETIAANGIARRASPTLILADGELGTIEYGSDYKSNGATVQDTTRIQLRVRALAAGA